MFGSRLQREFSRLSLGVGAQGAMGAGATVALMKIDMDDGIAPAIMSRMPGYVGVPCRARDGLGLPVHTKRADIIALSCPGLPTHIGADRPHQIDLMLLQAA